MQIWHYSPFTGELLGTGVADESPLEPGVWHLPAWSTPIEPPTPGEGQIAVFNGSWLLVANYRGEKWWRVDAVDNTDPIVIDFLGDPAVRGLTSVEPPAAPAPPVVVDPALRV